MGRKLASLTGVILGRSEAQTRESPAGDAQVKSEHDESQLLASCFSQRLACRFTLAGAVPP